MTHPLTPLAAYRQFITVKLIPLPNGKTDKLPVSPFGQVGVDAHSPANWQSWIEADAMARALGVSYTVGFVITKATRIWCLDIDNCRMADGSWSALAQQIFTMLPGAVVEISQSGKGLHLWFHHDKTLEHAKKNTALGIELYSDVRFIALGHSHVGAMAESCAGLPAVIAHLFPPRDVADANVPLDGPREDWIGPSDDDELIRRALGANPSMGQVFGKGDRVSFFDLWTCNTDALARNWPADEGGYDASSTDASLASRLAFWTGCDVERIERLMHRSALARDKYERADGSYGTYLRRTVMNACGMCNEVYRDPRIVNAVALVPTAPAVEVASELVGPAGVPALPSQPVVYPVYARALTPQVWPGGTTLSSANRAQNKPSLNSLADAIGEAQIWVGLDSFTGLKMVRTMDMAEGTERQLQPVDMVRLRAFLEGHGFNAVKTEVLRDVAESLADQHRYDSAARQLDRIVWDGVPRIDTFWIKYLGAADTPYTRACGAYSWTAQAGRILSPGCKADMAIILVGGQGAGKSTAIKTMALDPSHFGELDLEKPEDDLARQMRGKTVLEIPELRGHSRKDVRAMKSFLARAIDEWIAKYQENATNAPRRGLCYGTTNEPQFLNDPTGERRYLPFHVSTILLDAIERDREQLWAEGAARFRQNGVEWQAAQGLARAEHAQFTVTDGVDDAVAEYVADYPGPLRMEDLFMKKLNKPFVAAQRSEQTRVGNILKKMGYVKRDVYKDGKNLKTWIPAPSSTP